MKKTGLSYFAGNVNGAFYGKCCLSLEPIDDFSYIWKCEEPYMCFDLRESDKGMIYIEGKMEYVYLQLTRCGSSWSIVKREEASYDMLLSGPRWAAEGIPLPCMESGRMYSTKPKRFPR